MLSDETMRPENIRIDPVPFLSKFHTTVRVLRLDLIHPVVSGNKWFKLKEYLKEAKALNKKIIVTFGGAYSNHIVAAAVAAGMNGLKSIGIIRGEKPTTLSPTLQEAVNSGMELYFISREEYKKKMIPPEIFNRYSKAEMYVINEGGYGPKGVQGAKTILDQLDRSSFTHIITAVGTGTTAAGLIEATDHSKKIIGISVLKNNHSLQKEIEELLSKENKERPGLIHDYHFGGYAKYTQQLFDFMNDWYRQTRIPSDFVYTGKLFFALNDLIHKNYFPEGCQLLVIHSGGLQGNRSLPKGTLIF